MTKHLGHIWPTAECGRVWCGGTDTEKGPAMVYDKTRSGDPDYDDKQPPEFHAGGQVVSAGDGVFLSQAGGPVDAEGAHVSLVTDTQDLDNRPSPGNVAKAGSLVQDYDEEDTPAAAKEVEADSKDVEQIKSAQASVQAANIDNSGIPGMDSGADKADESRTRSADVTAAKAESTSAGRKSTTGK